jgi:hypothetical protein
MNNKQRLIAVLGMHRSGTSAITKGLEALGVHLGSDFYPPRPDNPKGDWEDRSLHNLNEELLRAHNQRWDDLNLFDPAVVLELTEGMFFSRAVAFIDERMRHNTLAGIKDPRLSVLLPFWKRVFFEAGISVAYVVSLRNPLSVAESLIKRNAIPKAKGLWLWVIHNVCIVSEAAQAVPIVVDYDELLDEPYLQLERLARLLNLTVKPDLFAAYSSDFLDPALRHTRFSGNDIRADSDCDPIVFKVYNELRTQALAFSRVDPVRWGQKASEWRRSLENASGFLDLMPNLRREMDLEDSRQELPG